MLLMSQSIERRLVARDTVIFLLQHLGFVGNLNKVWNVISHRTSTSNGIFRSCDKFDSNDSFFNRRESQRYFTGMLNNMFNERDNGFAVTTVSRSSIIHHTSSSSSSHSILLPATSTSVSPERKNVFQRKNYSKQPAAGRTAVRIGNLKYFNERYMIQGKPQIVIQTVASLGA